MNLKRTKLLIGIATSVLILAATGCGDALELVEPEISPESVDTASTEVAPALEATPEPSDPADAVLGHWYTEDDDSQIAISKDDGKIGGKIVWLKSPNYDEEGDEEFGQPRHDKNNPDEDLQARPIVGLGMIHGFTYDAGEGIWSGGSIYDPESGKTYKCQMTPGEGDTLDVRGYIGIPALGRTTIWRRVPDGEEKAEEAPTPSA